MPHPVYTSSPPQDATLRDKLYVYRSKPSYVSLERSKKAPRAIIRSNSETRNVTAENSSSVKLISSDCKKVEEVGEVGRRSGFGMDGLAQKNRHYVG